MSATMSLLRALLDHANDGIEIIDPETGRFLDVSEQACRALGYDRHEYLELSVPDIDPTMTPERWGRSRNDLRRTGKLVFESLQRRRDGSIFPAEISQAYIRLERDYILTVVRDITDRKRAEALVAGQNQVLERIAVGAPLSDVLTALMRLIEAQAAGLLCSILLLDEDGVHVRQGFAPSLPDAYVQSLVGLSIGPNAGSCGTAMYTRQAVIVPDILEDPLWNECRVLAAPYGLRACWSTPILSPDGIALGSFAMYYRDARSPQRAELRLIEIASNLAGIAIGRERAETALRESRERYRTLARSFPDGFVLVFDKDLRFLIADGAGLAAIHLSREMIEGRTLADVSMHGAIPVLEPIYRAALAGHENRQEFAHAGRLYSLTVVPVRDHDGSVNAGLAVYVDITALKQLEEQLRHAQKLEAVGRLAGGVAHDFNNLLTVINGCSELVMAGLETADPNSELVAEVRKAGERAARLTQQLLAFSRKQLLKPQVVSLNTLLLDLFKLLQRLIGEDVELIVMPDPALGSANVDPSQFEQAITNLVVNARDAMPHGGRLTIETHNAELDEEYVDRHGDLAPGPYVLVVVRDSGHGMDEATKARIFEPFFTTKEPGKGTGLGLAMVYGFVKQSGGHIEVHSDPRSGTTFKLYVPRATGASPGEMPPAVRDAPKGTETILLVEDEDTVRSFVSRVLGSRGYVVLQARDGSEALTVARNHAGIVHLLLTDVVMPRMSGRQLASRLTGERPEIRVLFMSGYNDEILQNGAIESGIGFLQKPFSPIDLCRKVRRVLDNVDR